MPSVNSMHSDMLSHHSIDNPHSDTANFPSAENANSNRFSEALGRHSAEDVHSDAGSHHSVDSFHTNAATYHGSEVAHADTASNHSAASAHSAPGSPHSSESSHSDAIGRSDSLLDISKRRPDESLKDFGERFDSSLRPLTVPLNIASGIIGMGSNLGGLGVAIATYMDKKQQEAKADQGQDTSGSSEPAKPVS